MLKKIFQQAVQIIWLQCFLVLIGIFLVWIFFGLQSGVALLYGGLANIVPNFVFAQSFFRKQKSCNPKKILGKFFIGEALKLIAGFFLLILLFKLVGGRLVFLIGGYILASFALFLFPFLTMLKK